MANYTDFQLELGEYGKAKEYKNDNAIVLAIRNILLSRPGNFPFNPSIGMNIRQYQFDILDDETVSNIQKELNKQIAKYIPDLGNVSANVLKIEKDGSYYLCFSISVDGNEENITANFVMNQNGDDVRIYNEIN